MTARPPTLEIGNAADAGAASRGWFVGDLVAWAGSRGETLDPAATPRQTAQLQVKWRAHAAGDERPAWADPDDCFSLSVLVDGDVSFDFRDLGGDTRSLRLSESGDYVLWHGPTYAHSWRTASGCILLTVRWPVGAGRPVDPATILE